MSESIAVESSLYAAIGFQNTVFIPGRPLAALSLRHPSLSVFSGLPFQLRVSEQNTHDQYHC